MNSFEYVLMCVGCVLAVTVYVVVGADSADASLAAAPLVKSMYAVFHPDRNA